MNSNLLTLKQAQEMGYGAVTTNRRRIKRGELPAIRRGKLVFVRVEDLENLYEPVTISEEDILEEWANKLAATMPKLSEDGKKKLAAILTAECA